MKSRWPVLLVATGLALITGRACASVAILDIGPQATQAQLRTLSEIARRTQLPLAFEVLPPLRAYRAVRIGEHRMLGYIKPQTLPQVGAGARLSVPVHISRRGLYESAVAGAPDGVVLLRGFVYDQSTREFLRPYSTTMVNDDAGAVELLRKGRVRYAVLDEFIFANRFQEDGLRKVRTIEEVTLHFAVGALAIADLAPLNAAICDMWREAVIFTLHESFYPGRDAFDALRSEVVSSHCGNGEAREPPG